MMRDANLERLHPVFRHYVQEILEELKHLGWQPVVAEAARTPEQQAEKVRNGVSKTMNSWHVPTTQGTLWESRESYSVVHGNAADIVDRRYGWNGPAASTGFKFWTDLGRLAKARGLTWGGDWKSFKDVAHIEWRYIDEAPRHEAYA